MLSNKPECDGMARCLKEYQQVLLQSVKFIFQVAPTAITIFDRVYRAITGIGRIVAVFDKRQTFV